MNWLLLATEHQAKWNDMPSIHDKAILVCTFLVVVFILFFAFLGQKDIGLVPKSWGAVFEHIFDWLDDVARSFMGPEGRGYVPLAMSMFLFVLISNWSGLIPFPKFIFEAPAAEVHTIEGQELQPVVPDETLKKDEVELSWESPTASFNTTLALAVISFVAFNIFGLAKKIFPPTPGHDHSHGHEHSHDHTHSHSHDHDHGHDHGHAKPGGIAGLMEWIAHFWQPVPSLARSFQGGTLALIPFLFVLFLGLNIVEEVARIMSLSIRLYGNIFGEHQVKENLINAIRDYSIGKDGAFALMAQGNTLGGFGFLAMAAMLWGTALFATCLGALAGFIQAMVFAMLSLSYIAHAVADEH